MKKQLISLSLLGFVRLTPVFAGNAIAVCPNEEFKTIQMGVNAATPGSTIQVCAGTYTEQVTINKSNLTLQAQGLVRVVSPTPQPSGTPPPVLPPNYGFFITAPNVRVSGFQITAFNSTTSAGIYVNRVNGTQITNNLIYGNCNGVVINQGGNTTVSDNNISQNPFPPPGDIVPQPGIPEPTQPVANSCVTFDPNGQAISADGFGVKTLSGRQNEIDRNDVEQNGQCGIQLVSDAGGSEVSRNRLFANSGFQGLCGNIDVRSPREAATQMQIDDNSVNTGINGIMLLNSDRVEITRNNVTRTQFGIFVMDSSYNEIDHNQVNNNFNTGIQLSGRYNEIDHNDVNNNSQVGIFITVDCGPSGQFFLYTQANTIDHNKATGNGRGFGNIDVEDFSSFSGMSCNVQPPPPTTTLDVWDQNKCGVSVPNGLCK